MTVEGLLLHLTGSPIGARDEGLCHQTTPSVHVTFWHHLPVKYFCWFLFCSTSAANESLLWSCETAATNPPHPHPPPRLFSIVCNNKALESIHLLITEPERSHERLLCYIFCLLKEKKKKSVEALCECCTARPTNSLLFVRRFSVG